MSETTVLPAANALPLADRAALEKAGLKVGDVLDAKYEIQRVLGKGGMGLVLGAMHLALRQPVALKLLLPSSLEDQTVVARFEREARAAAMLKSEHVARVIDVGRIPNGSPYMVMELLDGSDLELVVDTAGPLAPEVAVNYILQACEAIAEAHGLGIIHRDLKPHNLFLARRVDGEPNVKVLDFGISKLPNEEEKHLTRTTDVMGSPLYMAPEQLRSAREVDPRADVWALGAILFRLVTGRTPFDGETMAQLCARVLVEPPRPIRTLRPDLPEGLAQVIERCLEKEPEKRFSSVAELARALDPFAAQAAVRLADRVIAISARPPSSSHSVPPPPISVPPRSQGTVRLAPHHGALTGKSLPAIASSEFPPKKKRNLVPAIALLAIVGGGVAAWAMRGRFQPKPEPVPATATPPPVVSESAAPPPPVVSSVAAPPAVPVSASASASASASTEHRAPPIKKPWIPKKPTPASPSSSPAPAPAPAPAPNDDAPDLRK
jgi:serine/threonine-protein kinase